MDLWHGALSDFVKHAYSGSLAGDMAGQFVKLHRYPPSPAEIQSWDQSLAAAANAFRPLVRLDAAVRLAGSPSSSRPPRELRTQSSHSGIALEYHLPLTGKRIDLMITGRDTVGQPHAVILELKQWSDADLEDEHSTNVMVGNREHVHPSEQARDYAGWLTDYHSSFTSGELRAVPAAYCHNLAPPFDRALRDPRFERLLATSPLFAQGQEDALAAHVERHVAGGDGLMILDRLAGARFKPSKRVLDILESVLVAREEWHLLDEQRLAFNAILGEVRRQQAKAGRSAIIVRGAPGTGKTVVAVQLLAAALRLGWKAAHSTGGKAFTTALRSKFRGADQLFIWNMNVRTAPSAALDLLLVDEAHRVRETSDTRWTPRGERGKRSQTDELVEAAKVTVFLLDENQFVRPDEVGSTARFREEARRKRARFKEFDLAAQFRCSGCTEYVAWVDWLLGFGTEKPTEWADRYRVELVETPDALERLIPEARLAGESARVVAGFCWKWSDPPAARGELVPDVVIGSWRRPWNRKAGQKVYTPSEHPYTRWAQTEEGETQIGCIYSAQGFEFDRVGVIWGNDLVWRGDRWVAQPKESQDRPVKGSRDMMLALVRNAYRVLLTRGLRGARILVLDKETRELVRGALQGMQ